GTVAYMSPEQVSQLPLDQRSDIFSFGVVLYELLAGSQPFRGAADVDVLYAIVHQPAPALAEHVPAALRAIVERALQKDPAQRYQSMRDLCADLRQVARENSDTAVESRRENSWIVGATIVAVMLVAAAVTLFVFRPRETGSGALRPEYAQLTNFADS